MKTKNIIIKLIACALFVPSIIAIFLNQFSLYSSSTFGEATLEQYKLFADYSNAETLIPDIQTLWMLLNNILLIVVIALVLLYIVLFILQLFNVKLGKNINKICQTLGVIILIFSVLLVGTGVLSLIVNVNNIGGYSHAVIKIIGEAGLYLQIPAIIGGVVACIPLKK